MGRELIFQEHGLTVVVVVTDEGDVRLLHFSALPFERASVNAEREALFRLVEIQLAGEDHDSHHGSKYTGTVPGKRLRYLKHVDENTEQGRKWEIVQQDPESGLLVTTHWQFFTDLPVVRAWTEVTNNGHYPVTLEAVSSFALTGIAKSGPSAWDRKMRLSVPHSTCFGEGQWRTYTLPELGLSNVSLFSVKRLPFTSYGTWSTYQYLPMGYLENQESGEGLMWQIEHNGSWHWEVSDHWDQLYLFLSGPTDQEHQWYQALAPGMSFTTVPVAVCAHTSFDQAADELTRYRRCIRRPNRDNLDLPVIFNDYMNCLMGDPTEEKLLPLIDAAAEAGCEYFCIDAGWFAEIDESWWDRVGAWQPSRTRFPHGLDFVLQRIRDRGMIPGLWIEIEVMGVNSPLASQWPDACFFCRHGKRVVDHGRYQLDFRHPQVIAHADEAFDRMVQQYGVGYIKIDYNINAGVGTDVACESPGVGLLEHNRAYLAWIDRVFARYPDLVIETCSSGAMRMDYALLSRHSIQSSSDQNDYRLYPPIVTGCLSAITPEQCAVWAYPLETDGPEAVMFTMINALLARIHLSGHLAALSAEQFALVKEAIQLYKSIRGDIPQSVPFWPLGLPTMDAPWVCLGLNCGKTLYLALWRRDTDEATCEVTLPAFLAQAGRSHAACIYPASELCEWQWDAQQRTLRASLPTAYSARVFRVQLD